LIALIERNVPEQTFLGRTTPIDRSFASHSQDAEEETGKDDLESQR
jgi:hypothetical protein